MRNLCLLVFCFCSATYVSAADQSPNSDDVWIVAETEPTLLSPIIKYKRVTKSTIEACLPSPPEWETTKWVQHKTQFNKKKIRKDQKSLLWKLWKQIELYLVKAINKKHKEYEKVKNLFTYTVTEVSGDNIILTIYFKVPDKMNDDDFDLTCDQITGVDRESDRQSKSKKCALVVGITESKCFVSTRKRRISKRFSIPTLKKRYFTTSGNNGVRSGKRGMPVGKQAKFQIKFFEESDCSCIE